MLEPYRGYSLPTTTIINQHQEIQQMVGVAIYYFGGGYIYSQVKKKTEHFDPSLDFKEA